MIPEPPYTPRPRALGDELERIHMHVGKEAESAEPLACRAGHVVGEQLVDDLVPARVDRLVHEAPHRLLAVHSTPGYASGRVEVAAPLSSCRYRC